MGRLSFAPRLIAAEVKQGTGTGPKSSNLLEVKPAFAPETPACALPLRARNGVHRHRWLATSVPIIRRRMLI